VATCYRRLGRFTASIRAFHASIEEYGNGVPSSVLASCAQVELDLGLFDEAAAKFARILDRDSLFKDSVASYGYAFALFSIAERDLADGKAGVAFASAQRAIESCLQSSNSNFGCQFKLLGDLYSLGAAFPPGVFAEEGDSSREDLIECIMQQQSFVAKGEGAYRQFIDNNPLSTFDTEERVALQSSILCDISSNVLLQAQVLSSICAEDYVGSQGQLVQVIDALYDRAANGFREAIEKNPMHASSWCGLGCAVLTNDPLLAQHAFCRCLQLEKMSSDAYANMGFLYTSKMAFNASRSTMEALTQVADSPMMWMNCAFMLEREVAKSLKESKSGIQEEDIGRAADAYRASLQVMRHPEALLGLSLTCRVGKSKGNITPEQSQSILGDATNRKDSTSLLKEYMGVSASKIRQVSAIQGVMHIENSFHRTINASWQRTIAEEGKMAIERALGNEGSVASLNVGFLQKVKNASPKGKDKKQTFPSTLASPSNLQKQILIEPHRADLWLALAKENVRVDDPTLASVAASRAAFMLSQELTNEFGRSVVDSRMISDTLALNVWLKEIIEPKIDCMSESSCFDLQKALMMNPGNVVACRAFDNK
jgi:tetratricopeptide (TPR) repeat protein